MVITDFLERNARLYGSDTALVEVNPSEERDSAVTWREASLIAEAQPDAPYRRELSWRDFDRRANRFANFLLSRGVERGTKVGILLMNCLEWLPIYFGILKAGCIAVPLNFRYASDEISYCLDLADVEVLVFGPEFVSRLDPIQESLTRVKIRLFVGRNVPGYAEDCRRLMGFCSSSVPPIALSEDDDAAIYFSSGTTGFPKAILHRHKALVCSCMTEQHHHGQTKDDVFLCIPPLYHTGAKMHWFGSLISGSKAVLLRGVKPEWILRTITEENARSSGCSCPGRRTFSTRSSPAASILTTTCSTSGGSCTSARSPCRRALSSAGSNISRTTNTTRTTACPSPLAPAASIWAWTTSKRSAPSARPGISGRRASSTSRGRTSPRARSASWPSRVPAS